MSEPGGQSSLRYARGDDVDGFGVAEVVPEPTSAHRVGSDRATCSASFSRIPSRGRSPRFCHPPRTGRCGGRSGGGFLPLLWTGRNTICSRCHGTLYPFATSLRSAPCVSGRVSWARRGRRTRATEACKDSELRLAQRALDRATCIRVTRHKPTALHPGVHGAPMPPLTSATPARV